MLELNMTTLILVLGVLVFLTNAITESIKMAFSVKGSNILNKIALCTGIVLTVATYLGCSACIGAVITWYYIAAAVILGFVVSLAAMLGYDKVIQMWQDTMKRVK